MAGLHPQAANGATDMAGTDDAHRLHACGTGLRAQPLRPPAQSSQGRRGGKPGQPAAPARIDSTSLARDPLESETRRVAGLARKDQHRPQGAALARNVAATIMAKIGALAADPYGPNPDAKKLAGIEGYRLRVGDWRVLYRIEDGRLVIVVLAINPRGGAYK